MRKINTGDVFKMGRLLKNGNIMQIVKKGYEEGRKEDADRGRIGLEVFLDVVCSCADVKMEDQIYELLGGICEKTPVDVMEQSIETTIEDVKRIIRENDVANFLNSAFDLSKTA